ncbi:peptidylprolyl isomerase [Shimia sp.]|uniref:peptidylprolyl isomerase n=1 Tax=Shimia sp. TaxID=1954381 RepID=UPI0032978F2D
MSKHLKLLRAVAVSMLIASPSLAEDAPDISTVVADVNGQAITLGEMIAVRAALPEQYQSLSPDVLFQGILDQLIQQTALSQELDGVVPQRVEIALKNERRSLLAAEVLQEVIVEKSPTDSDIQAAYDAQFADFEGAPEFNASHILVETEEEANAVKESLAAGADFTETAMEKSTGPSGPSGGSLGWFGQGQMVKPFEDAVMTLAVGAVSEPVQTQFGWHLIILNDKRKQQAPSFEEVKDQIFSDLQTKAVDEYVTELTSKATIDRSGSEQFDADIIQRSDLLAPENAKD